MLQFMGSQRVAYNWATEQHVNCPSKLQAQRPVVQCHKDSWSTPIFSASFDRVARALFVWCTQSLSGVWLFGTKDSSPPGSSVHGILQVGIVEGVAIFPTQRLNSCLLCLLHWQSDSLPQSHLGSLAGALAVTKGNVLSIEATPGFFEVEIILELKGRREKWFCSLP